MMDVEKWDQKDIAAFWVVGAILLGGVLAAFHFWLQGRNEWLAIALAATVVIYHVWQVRTTLLWLQEEHGFRLGSAEEDLSVTEDEDAS